jgi:23S rRNA (pseudouridine1915-N3)-methyltransferase
MKIEFWSIGKQHDAGIKSAIEDYSKRINKYCSLKWEIIPVPKNAAMLSENDLKRLEGKMILDWIDKDTTLIALDEYGKELDSIGLANFITKKTNMGARKLVFLIGGAFGLDESVLEKADFKWSLSQLTFPHQLARLILAEQVYRAFTIIKNEKYHHK